MPGVEIFDRAELGEFVESDSSIIFGNCVEFSEYIETLALYESRTVTQVLIEYCEFNDVEYEDLSKMLTPSLKENRNIIWH